MNIKRWLAANTESLRGKTVALTGATGGLGEELCFYLAGLGARLILICRSEAKFNLLRDKICHHFPEAELRLLLADLENMEEVRTAADSLERQEVDILLLNAGAYSIPRRVVSTGFDNVFQINFVSQYYLARRLLEGMGSRRGRVVAVSSIAHNYSKSNPGSIDFADVKRASFAYGNAKRYLTYALFELFRGEKAASLSVVHPGISFTGITAHYPKLIFMLIKHPMKLIFMKPSKASLSILRGVFADTPAGFWIGPRFFDIWGTPSIKRLRTAKGDEINRIYKAAEEIYDNLK